MICASHSCVRLRSKSLSISCAWIGSRTILSGITSPYLYAPGAPTRHPAANHPPIRGPHRTAQGCTDNTPLNQKPNTTASPRKGLAVAMSHDPPVQDTHQLLTLSSLTGLIAI